MRAKRRACSVPRRATFCARARARVSRSRRRASSARGWPVACSALLKAGPLFPIAARRRAALRAPGGRAVTVPPGARPGRRPARRLRHGGTPDSASRCCTHKGPSTARGASRARASSPHVRRGRSSSPCASRSAERGSRRCERWTEPGPLEASAPSSRARDRARASREARPGRRSRTRRTRTDGAGRACP